MHNAVRWFLLWLLLPMMVVAADPPPPLVRSVLTTNLPAFGSVGQAIFRTTASPFLNWSNIPAADLTTVSNWVNAVSNAMWAGDNLVSNYVGAVSNAVWAGDNAVSNYVNAVSNLTYTLADGNTNYTVNTSNYLYIISSNISVALSSALTNLVLDTTNFPHINVTNSIRQLNSGSSNYFASATTFGTNNNVVVTATGKAGIGTNNPQALNETVGTNSGNGYLWRVSSLNRTGTAGTNAAYVNTNSEFYAYQSVTTAGAVNCYSISPSGYYQFGSYGILRYPSDATYSFRNAAETVPGNICCSNVLSGGQIIVTNMGTTTSGRIAIGTNSPQSALHVTADNSANLITQFGTTNQPQLFCIDTNGHVGIGTNNPQAVLDVFAQSNGPSQYILRVGNGMVAGASNVVVVSTNNRVGILSSSPSSSLDIVVNSGTSVIPVLGFEDSGGGSWGISLDRTVGTVARGYIGLLQGISGLTASNNYFWQFNWNLANTAINTFKNPDGNASPGLTTFNILQKTGQTGDLLAITSSNATMGNLVKVTSAGFIGLGTNSPQSALHVTGDNSAANVMQWGTTNRPQLGRVDTNGNMSVVGTITPTNGIINQVSNSFIANLTIVTNNPQLYCLNGTNQLITLPDCTKIPTGQIYRFSSTNGYGSVVITNATGAQTIRDGTSLDYKVSGVFSVAFFSDGAVWWIASKAKTIWPNASWSTSTNVPMAVTGSNYITFDTLETSNAQGISLTNGYQIYIRDAGQYLLTISLVTQVGHNGDTNRVWLQQSAQNVPRTRSDVKIAQTTGQQMMTVNFIVPVVTNLTWFGLCCRSTDTGSQFVTGAGADATMPAMPSAIVTVNKISDTFP